MNKYTMLVMMAMCGLCRGVTLEYLPLNVPVITAAGESPVGAMISAAAVTQLVQGATAGLVNAGMVTQIVDTATAGMITVEVDGVAKPIAEEALELAQAALPSVKTNGWETGSHAGFLTEETEPAWSAVSNVVTSGAALGATALQPSWATTGTVSRAEATEMVLSANGMTWTDIVDGKMYLYEVTNSTSGIFVSAVRGDGYNGPTIGTPWSLSLVEGSYTGISDGWEITLTPGFAVGCFKGDDVWEKDPFVSMDEIPFEIDRSAGDAAGLFTIDWLPVTNVYEVATATPTLLIIRGEVAGHNADTNTTAHAALFNSKANAETVVTGAVGTASSGYRYFWTTATNVVLSVNLSAGQVINYAAIRNTSTNTITATASNANWKWTGGSMTNSIPAGKMMTFGWAMNPTTGSTNAYATAASAN